MRKVSGIVTYTDHGMYYTLESMTVITSNKHHISLVVREKVEPYHYEHFTDLYKTVLNIAKNNDFYFDSFRAFETDWYDIAWIESAIPWKHSQFSYRER